MPDKAWKAFERRTSARLGGQGRTGPTGRNDADIKHPILNVSCKLRANIPKWILAAIAEARGFRLAGSKPTVLAVQAKGRAGWIAILDGRDFEKLFKEVK